MSILKDLINELRVDGRVEEVLVGAHWTMAQVRINDNVWTGLASTVLESGPHAETQVRDAGLLHTKTARELAEYAISSNPLEVSIGLAALNAILACEPSPSIVLNAADWLEVHGRSRRVALVGHFPFIPRLRAAAESLNVIEQNPTGTEISADSAAEFLGQADVVAITGMTLVNNTLDGLLRACRADAHIMVLGPSTPLTPRLFEYGIEVLSGAKVVDADAARRGVTQGAHLRQIEGVQLVTLANPAVRAATE